MLNNSYKIRVIWKACNKISKNICVTKVYEYVYVPHLSYALSSDRVRAIISLIETGISYI